MSKANNKGLTDKDIAELEKERQLVKERLAQREREFDLLVNTKPSRVKEIVTEGRNKRFNEIERKFDFMRKVQEEQTQEKLRKDRFEKASMRFGNIQNIDDIDQAIEDLDAQHSNIVRGGASTLPPINQSKMPKSTRFTSPKLEEEMRQSQLKFQASRFEQDNELQRKYTEINRDRELKRRLISAYGPRIAQFSNNLNSYAKSKLQTFYQPISEEKMIVLNSKLNSELTMQVPESVNHDFMETHKFYTKKYRHFLRNQKHSDGLYRQILKDFSEIKAMKKVLTNVPKLDEPKIYSNNKNEHTQDLLNIKEEYEEKMKLVGNQFLKYDLSNDTILDEVGRFIENGGNLYESESMVADEDAQPMEQRNQEKRLAQNNTGLVDQLMNKVQMRKNGSRLELAASGNTRGVAPGASILKKSSAKKVRRHARFGN